MWRVLCPMEVHDFPMEAMLLSSCPLLVVVLDLLKGAMLLWSVCCASCFVHFPLVLDVAL